MLGSLDKYLGMARVSAEHSTAAPPVCSLRFAAIGQKQTKFSLETLSLMKWRRTILTLNLNNHHHNGKHLCNLQPRNDTLMDRKFIVTTLRLTQPNLCSSFESPLHAKAFCAPIPPTHGPI
jgi:hypothetical protein